MDNLNIYDQVRTVPQEAQNPITGGRLKGMTDTNPMWRIKKLTELFGPCGIGWYTENLKTEFINGSDGTVSVFVDINLYIKHEKEWSKPIFGTGGSMFVAKESKGLYTSDEAVKMAYTDALSIACKALGFCSDIYFSKDKTKYDATDQSENPKGIANEKINDTYVKTITAMAEKANIKISTIIYTFGVKNLEDLTVEQGVNAMQILSKKVDENAKP